MEVFLLWHIYEQKDGFGPRDEEKLIGVFSCEKTAREAAEYLHRREGFREFPFRCFEIHKTELDRINWADGFSTVRWKE